MSHGCTSNHEKYISVRLESCDFDIVKCEKINELCAGYAGRKNVIMITIRSDTNIILSIYKGKQLQDSIRIVRCTANSTEYDHWLHKSRKIIATAVIAFNMCAEKSYRTFFQVNIYLTKFNKKTFY